MSAPTKDSAPSSAANNRVKSYRDLVVWQRAVQLGLDIYRLTAQFPDIERFGLAQQLRRAAVSVASNIAEGYGRGSSRDYLRFLRMARGGLCELETQLLFAQELGYISHELHTTAQSRIDECQRVLFGLIRSIKVT